MWNWLGHEAARSTSPFQVDVIPFSDRSHVPIWLSELVRLASNARGHLCGEEKA